MKTQPISSPAAFNHRLNLKRKTHRTSNFASFDQGGAPSPRRKPSALFFALTVVMEGFSSEVSALSDSDRLQRLEKMLNKLELRLERSEQENRDLRATLHRKELTAPAPAPTTQSANNKDAHSADEAPRNSLEIKQLNTKLRVLERKMELEKEESNKQREKQPKLVELGTQGLKVVSSDENFIMYLRALIQQDSSFFFEDDKTQPLASNGSDLPNNFYMRRIRPIIEGTVWKFVDYRFMPDFAPGPTGNTNPRIFDALVDLRYFREASLAAGIMKAPVSLERLASASHLSFVERAFPTQLAPNRETGLLLHGEFDKPDHLTQFSPTGRNMTATGNFPMYQYPDFFSYQVGVFDGTSNNGSIYSDSNDSKDFQGRVFSHPFIHSGNTLLEGLGIGMAGTYGTPNDVALSSFQSPGLQTIFSYSGNVTLPNSKPPVITTGTKADGTAYRIYPQGYWLYGPFKLVAEYASSNQDIANQILERGLSKNVYSMNETIESWNLTADYVLTGENNSFLNQGIRPRHPFNPMEGEWGAIVLAARYSPINFDTATFKNVGTAEKPIYPFADPRKSVASAATWALGVNWWLNLNTKLMFDYSETRFVGGAVEELADGSLTNTLTDRQTERVFQTRVQLAY